MTIRHSILLSAAFLSALFLGSSCEDAINDGKEPETTSCSITGFAQKGQLAKGSQVTAFAMDSDLVATGESFPANISDDRGAFSINGKTTAPYLELRADGYYG